MREINLEKKIVKITIFALCDLIKNIKIKKVEYIFEIKKRISYLNENFIKLIEF